MSPFDRILLLASLSFFFAALAVSLVNVYYDAPAPQSYMYTPQIEPAQTQPLENAERQYTTLPQSVLHYPADPVNGEGTIECFLEEQYKTLVAEKLAAGATLAARAELGTDQLEIYANEDGGFFAYVVGPDAIGQTEACEVAAGNGWRVLQR